MVGCVCIHSIYDRRAMLYNISNLLMIDSLPFSKHALRTSYGVVPQHWVDGKGPHLKWLPSKKEDYAWNTLFTKLCLKIGDAVPAPAV